MFRYVGLIWDPADPQGKDEAERCERRLMHSASGWNRVVSASGLRVYVRSGRDHDTLVAYPLARESGVVLGTVFHRAGSCDSDAEGAAHELLFSDSETDEIVESHGRSLMDSCWGRYVAFITIASQQTVWIAKDPTGRLPCFFSQRSRLTLVFSHMPDCIALGTGPLDINWKFIAARIALGCGRPDDTGIENIAELCGGECLEIRGTRSTRCLYWNPLSLFGRGVIEDPKLLAQRIRSTAMSCAGAWASKHEGLIHELSGGLDSSIVLACLADAPSRPHLTCLTCYRPEGRSDERPWAKLAAQSRFCERVEHPRSEFIDFSQLSALRPSASPPLTHAFIEIDGLERRLADQYHATAISSGDGGDSLFGSPSVRFSALDYARRHGIRPELLRIASDVALLGNTSAWSVLSKSLRYALSNQDRDDIAYLRDARLLASAEVREPILAAKCSYAHPWFRSGPLPQGAGEILMFLTLPDPFYPQLADPDEGVERVYPLYSQPLVELCASIPSYLHFDEGRDRGLARRAFSNDVPAPILDRSWKDRVQGFPEEILRANLPYFREMLLDGILEKEGYLDRAAVEHTLSGETVKGTASVGEILDHVLVEAWLRSWSAKSAFSQ